MNKFSCCLILASLFFCTSCNEKAKEENYGGIKVYPSNTWYWQFKQEPVLLLGASDYHNIFQRDDIVDELEVLQKHGGNYVRNTMASREITDMPDGSISTIQHGKILLNWNCRRL